MYVSSHEVEQVLDNLDALEDQATTILDQAQAVIDGIATERAALVRIYKQVRSHE